MDYSTPGFPILCHLLKFAQIHVHWVVEAIQPSHPLSSPFPPIFNLFQHQGLFQVSWLFTSGGQNWSFSFSISPSNEYSGLISFRLTGLISLLSKGLSRIFSSTTVQKHQFFGTQPSLWSKSSKSLLVMISTFVCKKKIFFFAYVLGRQLFWGYELVVYFLSTLWKYYFSFLASLIALETLPVICRSLFSVAFMIFPLSLVFCSFNKM